MERHTLISGETLEYPTPAPEISAFVDRVREMVNDPDAPESAVIDLIYSSENPLLDQTIFPHRGAVTKATIEDPVYHVMLDLLDQKRIQLGRLDLDAVQDRYTMSVTEAAEELGITPGGVRQAIHARRLAAWKKGGRYFLDPALVEAFQVSNRGPSKAQEVGEPLEVRMGTAPGVSFLLKAPHLLEDSTKEGSVRTGVLRNWRRVAVSAGKGPGRSIFIIEPGSAQNSIEREDFYVRGKFKIVRRIRGARAAAEAFKGFRGE